MKVGDTPIVYIRTVAGRRLPPWDEVHAICEGLQAWAIWYAWPCPGRYDP